MLPTFRRIHSSDTTIEQLQRNVAEVILPLTENPLLGGVEITYSGTGSLTISHLLGRQPVGWITTDRNSAATLYRTAWTSSSITLVASAALTAKIWLF